VIKLASGKSGTAVVNTASSVTPELAPSLTPQVYHAEEMVEGKIKGALFDQVLERKLLASKVLQNELGAYVRRHEYESLRRMVAEGRAASHMGVGGGLQQEEQASASAPAPGTGSGPLPPPRAEASPSDSTLMAVYQRLAQVEESLATHTELAASLTTRLDATQRSMAAAALQVCCSSWCEGPVDTGQWGIHYVQ
jgi:hypothetical protein